MENNLENKAKFFAQYWGQNVIRYNKKSPLFDVDFVDFIVLSPEYFIELKHLSLISDEDAVNVAKIENNYENPLTRGKAIIRNFENMTFSQKICSEIVDYLRLKGYAIPFNGLSVEELVKIGWVRLKTI